MGLVSLGSLLNNYFVFFKLHSSATGSWQNVTAVDVILQGLTIGANTGQHDTPFNLLQVGCSELVTTLVFLLYLAWLKQFNADRELAMNKSTLSAADYTIQVRGLHTLRRLSLGEWCGLSRPKNVPEEEVATVLAGIVQRSWADAPDAPSLGGEAGVRERGWWYGRDARDMAMRLPLTDAEKRVSALMAALQKQEESASSRAPSDEAAKAPCRGCCATRPQGSGRQPGWSSIVFSVQNWGSFVEPGVFATAQEPTEAANGEAGANVELAAPEPRASEEPSYYGRYVRAASIVQGCCGTIRDWFARTNYDATTAFVTFRYAADASEAIRAIARERRAPCSRFCSCVMDPIRQYACGAQTSVAGLRAEPAPEVDDVIWQNLWHDSWVRRHVRPLATNTFYIVCCTIFFMFILSMTSAKLALAMRVSLDQTLSEYNTIYDSVVLWIFNHLGLRHLEDSNVLLTLLFSLLIKILNDLLLSDSIVKIVPNPLRGAEWMVRQERLTTASREQLRLMTLITVIYITNYVIVLFIAHTPLAQGHENLATLLANRTDANDNHVHQAQYYATEFLSGCFDQVNERLWMVAPTLVLVQGLLSLIDVPKVVQDVFGRVVSVVTLLLVLLYSYAYLSWNLRSFTHDSDFLDAHECNPRSVRRAWRNVQMVLQDNIQFIADHAANDSWYTGATGLIPTMIILLLLEIAYGPLLEDGITFLFVKLEHILSRRHTTQEAINKAFEPPEFAFAYRYASCLKIAAIVLVFAPAAPLLYFVGTAVVATSFAIQKLALVKMYKRPRALDASLAERSRTVLYLLLVLKTLAACLFQVRQALVANRVNGSDLDLFEDSVPLIIAILAVAVYGIFDFVVAPCLCHARPTDLSEAEEKQMRYMQACDELPGFAPYAPDDNAGVRVKDEQRPYARRNWKMVGSAFALRTVFRRPTSPMRRRSGSNSWLGAGSSHELV